MKKMQKAVAFLLTAVLVLTLLPSFAASVIHASETAETVKAVRLTEVPEGYTGIYTKEDLNNVRNNLAGNYILMNDIVFSEADFAEDGDFYCGGTGWTPIGDSANPFIGIFDGNCYAVKNLYVNVSGSYAGLFGYVRNGKIQNLGMEDGSVSANSSSAARVGGIAGYNSGTITNCYNTGSVSAFAYAIVGGIAGENAGAVTNCYNTGAVSANTENVDSSLLVSRAGGILGRNLGTAGNCYNEGSVSAVAKRTYNTDETPRSTLAHAGGIAGQNFIGSTSPSGTITNCYNTGSVSAATVTITNEELSNADAGGIAGYNDSEAITSCYNVGSVSAEATGTDSLARIGGIAGYNASETVTNCYYLDTASKGAGEGTDACTKCTAEELKEQDTFVGFDFDSVWTMQGDGDYLYPELQNVAGTLVPEKSTDLTVNYTDYVAAEKVYSLDVVWENSDFSFDYDAGSEGTWNPAEHRFENSVPAKWIDDDLNVTVANHSNAAVQASLSVVNLSDKVTVAANQDSVTLNSAEGTAIDAAPSFTFVLTVTGEPTESITRAATATVSFASETAPVPVSPSNLTDRVYTLIKPDPDNALGVCDKTLYVRELSFGANGGDEEFTYVCQEHCPCPSTEDPAHACLTYGGEPYCRVYGAGSENIYEITGNLINEGSFTLELLSNDTLRVVSATEGLIISVGDIFS